MDYNQFYCLNETELMEIDGGIEPITIAALIIGGIAFLGFTWGIYNGYTVAAQTTVKAA